MRHGERHQQDTHAKHQPGLVGIPEGADAGDHGVLLVFVIGAAQKHPHTEVIPIQDHIGQHGQRHDQREHQGQPPGGLAEIGDGEGRQSVKHGALR